MPLKTPQITWVEPHRLDDRMDAKPFQAKIQNRLDAIDNCVWPIQKLGSSRLNVYLNRGVGGAVDDATPIRLYKTRHIREGYLEVDSSFLPQEKTLGPKRLRLGDVLLTSTGLGTIGRAALFTRSEKATVDNHVTIIRPTVELNSGYLISFLNSSYGFALSDWGTTGSTGQLELTREKVAAFRIPIPDRRIQDYIGAKVELAERCRAEAQFINIEIKKIIDDFFISPPSAENKLSTYVEVNEFDSDRFDAWYYQRNFIELYKWLKSNPTFIELSKISKLSKNRWSQNNHKLAEFLYLEISDINIATGQIIPHVVKTSDAPSRAKKLVTVQPMLRKMQYYFRKMHFVLVPL